MFGILLYSPYTSDLTDCYTLTEDIIPTHCQIIIGRTLSSDQARLQGLVACSKLGPVYRWVLSKVFSSVVGSIIEQRGDSTIDVIKISNKTPPTGV